MARLAWDRLFYSKNTRQIIWILSWKVCNFPLDSCLKAVDVKSMIMDYIPVEVLSQPGIAGILTLQHESFISPLGDFIGSLFFALKVWHFQRGVVVNREPVWEISPPHIGRYPPCYHVIQSNCPRLMWPQRFVSTLIPNSLFYCLIFMLSGQSIPSKYLSFELVA